MSSDYLFREIQKAVKARKTEAAERNAIASILSASGWRKSPEVRTGRLEDGRTVRIYLFENTPAGSFVLVAGPDVEGEVLTLEEVSGANREPGVYLRAGASSAKGTTDAFTRAASKASSKGMSYRVGTPAAPRSKGMEYSAPRPGAVPRGKTRREAEGTSYQSAARSDYYVEEIPGEGRWGMFRTARPGQSWAPRALMKGPRDMMLEQALKHQQQYDLAQAEIAAGGPLPDTNATYKAVRKLAGLESVRPRPGHVSPQHTVYGDSVLWRGGHSGKDGREVLLADLARAWKDAYKARHKHYQEARKALDDMERLVRAGAWSPSQGDPTQYRTALAWARELNSNSDAELAAEDYLQKWEARLVAEELQHARSRHADEMRRKLGMSVAMHVGGAKRKVAGTPVAPRRPEHRSGIARSSITGEVFEPVGTQAAPVAHNLEVRFSKPHTSQRRKTFDATLHVGGDPIGVARLRALTGIGGEGDYGLHVVAVGGKVSPTAITSGDMRAVKTVAEYLLKRAYRSMPDEPEAWLKRAKWDELVRTDPDAQTFARYFPPATVLSSGASAEQLLKPYMAEGRALANKLQQGRRELDKKGRPVDRVFTDVLFDTPYVSNGFIAIPAPGYPKDPKDRDTHTDMQSFVDAYHEGKDLDLEFVSVPNLETFRVWGPNKGKFTSIVLRTGEDTPHKKAFECGLNPVYLAACMAAVGTVQEIIGRHPLHPVWVIGSKGKAIIMPVRLD